jgi:hypothetical protein
VSELECLVDCMLIVGSIVMHLQHLSYLLDMGYSWMLLLMRQLCCMYLVDMVCRQSLLHLLSCMYLLNKGYSLMTMFHLLLTYMYLLDMTYTVMTQLNCRYLLGTLYNSKMLNQTRRCMYLLGMPCTESLLLRFRMFLEDNRNSLKTPPH